MHVLSIIHYPVFGGPHNRNMRLAPKLEQWGVHTTVVLPAEDGSGAERLIQAGLRVLQVPLHRVRNTRDMRQHFGLVAGFPGEIRTLRQIIRNENVDVVQINGLVNPHGALAGHAEGVPVVWQILDTHTPMILRRCLSPFLKRYADVIMCTGGCVADEHPGATAHSGRLVNFFPPVDMQAFTPSPIVRDQVRDELGLTGAEIVIGTLGNINRQKGHKDFVRAAAAFKAHMEGARFVILGATHSNHAQYVSEMNVLASDLGLQSGKDLLVLDPGRRANELMQAFDVFWMTPAERSEGIPTAMEEAMALELPVVSFDVGSISELVLDGKTGYVVTDRRPESVAQTTLENLLDPERRKLLGNAGREFVDGRASVESCARRHADAYRIALAQKRIMSDCQ